MLHVSTVSGIGSLELADCAGTDPPAIDCCQRSMVHVISAGDAMQIEIDVQRCAGTGMCTGIAPAVFHLGESGKASLLIQQPSEEFRQEVRMAERGCPVGAIRVGR